MQNTQKFIITLVGIVAVAGIIIAGFVSLALPRPEDQLSVTAEGKIFAPPTVAEITLGVKSENKRTAEEATKDNVTKMNKVIEAVKAAGVEVKDIQTVGYNLVPQYERPKVFVIPAPDVVLPPIVTEAGENNIVGWILEQNVRVKVRKVDTLGEVIAKATAAGANQAGGALFSIDDKENLKAQARADAVEKAKRKAEALAREAGIKLGKIVNVYVNDSDPYPPVPYVGGMGGEGVVSVPDVQPGENEIVVQVTLVYKVK